MAVAHSDVFRGNTRSDLLRLHGTAFLGGNTANQIATGGGDFLGRGLERDSVPLFFPSLSRGMTRLDIYLGREYVSIYSID